MASHELNHDREADAHFWPASDPSRSVPTPYAILNQHPKAAYTKSARFYELVKLYHPDRVLHPESSRSSRLPKHIRLERYRLVVSAHAILSDPAKRREYDLYGAGWAGATTRPMPDFNMSAEAREAVMHNATWQDWENWYDRFHPPKPGEPPRKPQQALYTSNTAFVGIVGVLAALAGIGQATRAHDKGRDYTLVMEQKSVENKRELGAVRESKNGLGRQERIDYFVRDRDPQGLLQEEVEKIGIGADGARVEEGA